jgi:hypothetical protein
VFHGDLLSSIELWSEPPDASFEIGELRIGNAAGSRPLAAGKIGRAMLQDPMRARHGCSIAASQHTKMSSSRNVSGRKYVSRWPAFRRLFSSEVHMKILITAAMLSAFALSPASAAMMACTGDNMMKSTTMMSTMPETPGKMAANKEIGMANADMSNGRMKSACMHYMKAQKAAMMK